MKLFVKVGIFLVFTIAISCLPLSISENKLGNGETETNLPVILKNKSYDFVLLGSSHARIFSRAENHNEFEKLLQRSFINLSQGGNRESLKNQKTYLSYFYQRGNTNRVTVYFLDPFIFYRRELLSNPHIFDHEPFRLDFLYTLLTSGDYNWKTTTSYLFAMNQYKTMSPTQIKQSTASAQIIQSRMKSLYLNPIDTDNFRFINEVNELSLNHGAKLVVIIPPTLFPKHKQAEEVKKELVKLQKTEHFALFDFSEVMKDPKYFLDSDHLNNIGIERFVQRYLRPILH